MQFAIDRLIQVAPTDLSVLITGETGTGKEIFAHAIHGMSKRRKFPFVSVNCGAIPETLLESELFGHEKGAFTGAAEQRKGFFEVADKGTIFLDEIGEMPVTTQVKLLRVLESGEFSRLGSSDLRRVDVRLIAATNRDLEYEVRRGNFRQDLFFRMNSIIIHLPPLRQHIEDIPQLVDFFGKQVAEKINTDFEGISSEALAILQHAPWHGNTRELRNLVESVVTLEQGEFITPDVLRRYVTKALPAPSDSNERGYQGIVHARGDDHQREPIDIELIFRAILRLQQDVSNIQTLLEEKLNQPEPPTVTEEPDSKTTIEAMIDDNDFRLAEMESRLIESALRKFKGNRRRSAKALGMSERTLYRKIEELQLDIPYNQIEDDQ